MDCVHLLGVIYALILRRRSHWSAGSLRLISDGLQSGVADEEALEMASTAKVRWAALRASRSLFAFSFCLQPEGCDGRGEGLSKEREKGGTPSVDKSLSRVTSHPHLSRCVSPPNHPSPSRPPGPSYSTSNRTGTGQRSGAFQFTNADPLVKQT